jgi:uncharacterized small protein (DUF1192 family)
MTTTEEMINAIDNARTFMYSLLDPKQTPRVPKSVRKYAKDRLKHFPTKYNTIEIGEELSRLRAEVAALKAERDKERRDACRSDAYAVHGVYTPEELAKGRGWDCFKEGTEQC